MDRPFGASAYSSISGASSDEETPLTTSNASKKKKKTSASASTSKQYDISSKPTVSDLTKRISSLKTTTRCHTLLLLILALITLLSTFSLHSTLGSQSTATASSISSQNTRISAISSLLDATISSISRFNTTVTNGELLAEVSDLHKQVDEQLATVKTLISDQESKISKELSDTTNRIDADLSTAQEKIDNDINSISGTLHDYQSDTATKFTMENNFMMYQLAGTFTLLGCLISVYHVSAHLRNFHNPVVQRKILAILWMAPIYSMSSWFSLVFPASGPYLSILKDCYEAYCVYTFLSFLIAVMGNGDHHEVIRKLAEHPEHIRVPITCCGCWYREARKSAVGVATTFLYQCLFFCLQFVVLKPFLAVANFAVNDLQYFGPPHPSDYHYPSLYILVLQNLSVSLAFYGLLTFFHAVSTDLDWCVPWPKFLCIKGVVFVTFWQGMAISLLAKASGGEKDELWGKQAQSFLICIEMLLASIAHFYVFPHEEWKPDYKRKRESQKVMKFGDNLALRDFFHDIKMVMGPGTKKKAEKKEGEGGGDDTGGEDTPEDNKEAIERIRMSLASMEEGGGEGVGGGGGGAEEALTSIGEESALIGGGGGGRPTVPRVVLSKNFRRKGGKLHR